MSKYIGRLLEVGIGKETVRGSGVAPAFWLPKVGFSFDDKVTIARSQAGIGKLADSDEAFVVNKFGEGEIEMNLGDQSVGYFLYSLLGSLSTSGPVDSAYTHAFSIAETNTHQSLAFVVKDPNTTEDYKLVMVNSFELEATLEELVKITVGFLSKKGNAYSSVTPSYTNENRFTKNHISFKVADTIGNLAAATGISVKNLTLNITQNTVTDDALNTAEPEDILNQQLSVEGEVVLRYEDETWKNYFKTPTNRAMEIKFQNIDKTIGAGTRPSLTIQLPKVDFFEWEPDYTLDEIVLQTISFKGSYDIANSLNIISTCSLVNAKTSY
jgi:hypothetical protein